MTIYDTKKWKSVEKLNVEGDIPVHVVGIRN